jgi:hypothetical protein
MHFINGEKWWVGMGFWKAGKSQPFFFFAGYIYKAKKLHKEIKVLKISGFQVFQ